MIIPHYILLFVVHCEGCNTPVGQYTVRISLSEAIDPVDGYTTLSVSTWPVISHPQSTATASWPVFIYHPIEGRRPSWSKWLVAYQDSIPWMVADLIGNWTRQNNCQCLGHTDILCKNDWTNQDDIWRLTRIATSTQGTCQMGVVRYSLLRAQVQPTLDHSAETLCKSNALLDGVKIGEIHSQLWGVKSWQCCLLPNYFAHFIHLCLECLLVFI